MKAKIVESLALRESEVDKQAQALILKLLQAGNKKRAIQVLLEKAETPRKIHRIFRQAAEALNKEIRITSKQGKTIIRVK